MRMEKHRCVTDSGMFLGVRAFTAIEIIVAIFIVGVLGTIAIVWTNGNLEKTRNVSRMAHLSSLSKALDEYAINQTTYPLPDSAKTIFYSWSAVFSQGTISDGVSALLRLSTVLKDPSYGNHYAYSVTSNGAEYQLAAVAEDPFVAVAEIIARVSYAERGKRGTAIVQGNYNWLIAPFVSGAAEKWLALPSIVLSDLSASTVDLAGSGTKAYSGSFVVQGRKNAPDAYRGSNLSRSGDFSFVTAELPRGSYDQTGIVALATSLRSTYSLPANVAFSNADRKSVWAMVSFFANTGSLSKIVRSSVVRSAPWNVVHLFHPGGTAVSDRIRTYSASAVYASGDRFAATLAHSYEWVLVEVVRATDTNGFTLAKVVSYSDGTPANSGGCDTADIVIANGLNVQAWSACNLGATVSTTGTGEGAIPLDNAFYDQSRMWYYFQWGNNAGMTPTTLSGVNRIDTSRHGPTNYYSGTTFIKHLVSPYDWSSFRNDDLWGNATDTADARKWPCPVDYHVPTTAEIEKTGTIFGVTSVFSPTRAELDSIIAALRIPFSGIRNPINGSMKMIGSYGHWWHSSLLGDEWRNAYFGSGWGSLVAGFSRAAGFSVRCIRN